MKGRMNKNKITESKKALKEYFDDVKNNQEMFSKKKPRIPLAIPPYDWEEVNESLDSLLNMQTTMGKKVKSFEKKFAEYLGVKYALMVNSGSSANLVALSILSNQVMGKKRIGKNDEIITPAVTWATTVYPIVNVGAKPVFVDVEKETYNIDPEKIEKAITKKTKAIMPIHYGGQCSEMDKILEIAEKHNLSVIEDAAPAIGGIHKQRKAGTFGKISAFSFFPDKNMTTGEGGMIVTDNEELSNKCKELRKNGASSRYYHTSIGWNFKMPDPNAALGSSQLKRIESIIEKKNVIAKYYQTSLEKINGIQPPIIKQYNRHTFMLYSILTKDPKQRELVKDELAKNGIETRINFPSVHLQPIYKQMFGFQNGSFPISEDLSERVLGLPIFIKMTHEQQDQVVNIISKTTK